MSATNEHAVGVLDEAVAWMRPRDTLRTLPIRLRPVQGEALDSWLEASAHRLHTHLGDLLGVLAPGADDRGSGARRSAETAHWIVQLTATAAERIAAITGVASAELHEMTLARYDGSALRLTEGGRTVDIDTLWGRRTRSRFCPDCLAESGGRWQLWWRLGWAFACPEHHQLLADICPRCQQPQRQRSGPSHVVPQPSHCARPPIGQTGLAERRCNGNLTQADVLRLPEDHPALAAQHLLLEAIHAGAARFGIYGLDPPPVAAALTDTRALARRILRYATAAELAEVLPGDLVDAYRSRSERSTPLDTQAQQYPGLMAPAQAITTAVGLTAAFTILGAPSIPQAGGALRWLVDGCRRDGLVVSASNTRAWGRRSRTT